MNGIETNYLFDFNLQLLDDGGDGGAGGDGSGDAGGAGDGSGGSDGDKGTGGAGAEKTFSQADVSAIAAKESKKATEALLKDLGITDFNGAKDGMAKFKEWQDSQKTDLEKITGEVDGYKTTISEKDAIIKGFQNKEIVTDLGVSSKNAAKVLKLAELEDGDDLKANVEKVLKEYPMFKGEAGPGQFGAGTGGQGSGGGAATEEDAIRKSMGLGPKK